MQRMQRACQFCDDNGVFVAPCQLDESQVTEPATICQRLREMRMFSPEMMVGSDIIAQVEINGLRANTEKKIFFF